MPIVQHQLAFARPLAARVRSVRRTFHPTPPQGPYKLPHEIKDRLTAALTGFRNRDAAYALAVFLARFWSSPGRVTSAFPVDRRALVDHESLELSENRIRGAIKTLEAVGFLERSIAPLGSRYKATADGLRRKVVLYVFGAEFAPLFLMANRRAGKAVQQRSTERRTIAPSVAPRASTGLLMATATKSPKNKSEAKPQVLMGELRQEVGLPAEPSAPSALELALQRLSVGVFGRSRVG